MGVLLLNMGGPGTPGAARPFLYNLFSDRDIIRLGPAFMQLPLAWLISTMRSGKARGYYSLIGGKSPILDITTAQALALEEALSEQGEFKVYIGMGYWKPYISDTLNEMESDGVQRAIALTLYPQYSTATTGSSERRLAEVSEDHSIEFSNISHWYDHPLYLDALAELIRKGIDDFGGGPAPKILFSAHSLPKKFIDEGDPYVTHLMATINGVAARLGMEWSLGYQSRSGPVEWLSPSTEEMLETMGMEGVKRILMVPISFVSDHIETLYEIDILYRGMAESHGIELRRTESLNTYPLFIKALKDIVLTRTKSLGWTE